MRKKQERVCTICARGGSKGVPGKNIRELAGKPLIAWSIEQAHETNLFDVIAVSSDSDEILETAKKYGANILIKRPDEMATDTAGKHPVIRHAVLETEKQTGKQYKTLVDLDATAPLRTAQDIIGAVELMEKENISNVITAAPARRSPYFNLVELHPNGTIDLAKKPKERIVRRQDAPQCFDMNASIYVWNREPFLSDPKNFYPDTKLFVMPEIRSVDIDSELDFKIVELIMQTTNYQEPLSHAA